MNSQNYFPIFFELGKIFTKKRKLSTSCNVESKIFLHIRLWKGMPFHWVCAILLRLYTSTERIKRLYTSPGSLLEIFYFR